MDLLPKDHKKFQDQEFWAKFFQDKKTEQGFEWYATYEDLEYLLKMTLKDKEQRLLVLGCGNSLLSEKMHQKLGLKKITSIDFEENVVKKMKNRDVPVDYQVMDMLNMTFPDESFDYAIDKGSLDAVCADNTPETAAKVVQYLNEVQRVVVAKGGTYVCVSLLQDFVLDALVSFFCKGVGNKTFTSNITDFRIQRLEKNPKVKEQDPSNYIPFFITIKRTAVNPEDQKIQEMRKKVSDTISFQESPARKAELLSSSTIAEKIKREQISHMMLPQMKELVLGQKFELLYFDDKRSANLPRYTLTVIDSNDVKILKKKSCGAFITPQGKERESLIQTEVGQ